MIPERWDNLENFNGVRAWTLDLYKPKKSSEDNNKPNFEKISPQNKAIDSVAKVILNDYDIKETNVDKFQNCHIAIDVYNSNNAFILNEQDEVVGGIFSSTKALLPMAIEGSEEDTRQFFEQLKDYFSKKSDPSEEL